MQSLSIGHLIPSVRATFPTRWFCPYFTSEDFSDNYYFLRRSKKQISYSHNISRSKRSLYQDFQDFAKPLHLLPATEVTTYSKHFSEEIISLLELDKSTSLYMVELCTSRDSGSCLSDLNAAILICLIDEDGRSILQRISAISQERNIKISEYINFQRGSVHTATFKGPKLENVEALWIGLESGSWRVDGVGVKVVNGPTSLSSSNELKNGNLSGRQYKFDANNILLGEGGLSIIELRPTFVTELSSINSSPETPVFNTELSKKGSMEEYAELKFSLLLYDFVLVLTGATILTVSSNETSAYSFLAGGLGGFLYLLLLQRSVDGLSVPLLSSEEDKLEISPPNFGGFKGALLVLASVMLTSAVASKYWTGGRSAVLSSSEIFAGVAGFLTCKIAVVLAAFRPIRTTVKEK